MARNDADAGLLPIWREVLEAGEALPSEEELAAVLGMSRPAVREALIRMEADGLIRRHHGAGTFPNPMALEVPTRLDREADFADRLAAIGYRAEVELLAAEVIPLGTEDPARVARLGGDVDARVLRTTKRWRADGVVAVVAVDLVPLARRVSEEAAIAAATSPMVELAASIGTGRADWMCTWPSAVELDAGVAELLEFPVGRAVQRMEQVGVERHGRRVFHAIEHHRPELLEYGLIRTIR